MSDLATRCCKGVSVARHGAAFAEAGSRSGLRTGSLGRGSDGGVTDACGPLLSARVDGIAGSARLAMLGPRRLRWRCRCVRAVGTRATVRHRDARSALLACLGVFVSCAPVEKPPDTVPRLTGLPLQGRTYNTSASRQCFLSSPQPNRTVEKRSPTTPFRGVVGRRPARRKRIRISGATQQGVE